MKVQNNGINLVLNVMINRTVQIFMNRYNYVMKHFRVKSLGVLLPLV